MSYVLKKQYAVSPDPSPRRVIISSPDPKKATQKYFVKRDHSMNNLRYITDDGYDGYVSDSPVIIQRPTPRHVIVDQTPRAAPQKYVYVEESEESEEEDVFYLINGKYYKSKPQRTTTLPPIQPQRENVVYYVDDNNDDDDDDDDSPVIQKKIVINKKSKPETSNKVIYVNDTPQPRYMETPRVRTIVESPRSYRPKAQPVIVRQTLRPLDEPRVKEPQQMKPLQKIILENRSKPRNNYRREIERVEIKDKPLPNRNIIHGNTIVYK